MKCPYCETNLPDDAVFCASCGKRVDDTTGTASPTVEEQPATSPTGYAACTADASETAKPSPNPTSAPSFLATKKGKSVAAGILAALICAVIAIVVGMNAANNVPEETVRQAMQASSTVANGIASDNYVDPSPYKLSAFKIDKQEDEQSTAATSQASAAMRHVYFSGTIENDFFKTDFTGEAYYTKQGDTWACTLGPGVTSSTTTPLQGVAHMSASSDDNDYEISDFASTFDSDNGNFTSVATQNVAYKFWFGTDTATNTRTFVFDGSSWTPAGDVAVSNMQSHTNLAGKKFEYMDTGSSLFKTGTTTSTIEFASDGENGAVSATYTLNWKYSGDTASGAGQYYLPVSLSGNLEGTVDHSFGQDDFDIELNDADNQVSFTGGESYATVSAGDGETNTLSLSVSTNAKSFESPYQTTMYRMSMGTWVEKA